MSTHKLVPVEQSRVSRVKRMMKTKHILALATVVSFAAPVMASASVCEQLANTIDSHLKRAAIDLVRSELYPSNTGPAQLRQQGLTNHMLMVQVNVGLMQQNNCAALKTPINPYDYFFEATQCAMESQVAGGRLDTPKCKMDEWPTLPAK